MPGGYWWRSPSIV